MRTTINLDDDLLREAKKQAALSDRSLSAFITDAVREAVAVRTSGEEAEPVHLVTVKGELLPGVNYDSFASMNDLAESRE